MDRAEPARARQLGLDRGGISCVEKPRVGKLLQAREAEREAEECPQREQDAANITRRLRSRVESHASPYPATATGQGTDSDGAGKSPETAVGCPESAGAAGSLRDQRGQFGLIRDGERDVGATAARSRPAIGLRREGAVSEEPDVKRGQHELLTASAVSPAELIWNLDVDRERGHLDACVAAHGGILTAASRQGTY